MSNDALGTAGGIVSAAENRIAQTAMVAVLPTGILDARTGVMAGPNSTALITGTSATGTMTVNVAAFQAVTSRTSAQGTYMGPTFESGGTVNIAAAPASNSRIDVVYAKQQDSDASVLTPDGTSAPLLSVATGTAAASPTKPSIPVGALELGTVTVAAGATSTNGAGVTIANTARQTVAHGGIIPALSGESILPAFDGQTRYYPGTGLQVGVGGAWGPPVRALPYCQVKQNTTQIVPISTWTTISMDGEMLDTDAMHSPTVNNSRVTCTVAGVYQMSGTVAFADPGGSSTLAINARLMLNGAVIDMGGGDGSITGGQGGASVSTPTILVQLAVGDYIELQGYQPYTSASGGLHTRIASDHRSSLSAQCIRLI